MFIAGYGVIRFMNEFFRADPRLYLWDGGPPVPQAASLAAGVAGLYGLYRLRPRRAAIPSKGS